MLYRRGRVPFSIIHLGAWQSRYFMLGQRTGWFYRRFAQRDHGRCHRAIMFAAQSFVDIYLFFCRASHCACFLFSHCMCQQQLFTTELFIWEETHLREYLVAIIHTPGYIYRITLLKTERILTRYFNQIRVIFVQSTFFQAEIESEVNTWFLYIWEYSIN